MITASQLAARLPVAVEMRFRRWLEGEDARLAALLTDPSRLFVDAGANAGLYSWIGVRLGAPVLAVEPHPEMAERLRTRLPGIEVVEAALSDEPGRATLLVPSVGNRDVTTRSTLEDGANEGFATRAVEVDVVVLDQLLSDRSPAVGFLKVDVEGHEAPLLRGAARVLERDRPVVLMEIEWRHHGERATDLVELLLGAGYRGSYLVDGQRHDIADFDPERLQPTANLKRPGVRFGRGPTYVNNFLFVHRSDEAALSRLRHHERR